MKFTKNLTDGGCTLSIAFIGKKSKEQHGVKYPSVNGFQAVPDIRKCPVGDYTHCIFYE